MNYWTNDQLCQRCPAYDPYPPATAAEIRRAPQRVLPLYEQGLASCFPSRDQKMVVRLLGGSGRVDSLLASNLAARAQLGVDALYRLCTLEWEWSDWNFYPIDMIMSEGWGIDRDTPIRLDALRAAIRNALQNGHLDGWFGIVRFEMLVPCRGDASWRIAPVFNGIGWVDYRVVHHLDIRDAIQGVRRRRPSKARCHAVAVGTTHQPNVSGIVQRMFERPLLNRTWPFDAYPWRPASIATPSLTPCEIARLLELHPVITLRELILGGGQYGYPLSRSVALALKLMLADHRGPELTPGDAEQFWERVRANPGCAYDFPPVTIMR